MMENIEWLFFDVGSTLVDESKVYEYRMRTVAQLAGGTYEYVYNTAMEFYKQNKKGDLETIKWLNVEKPKWKFEYEVLYEDALSNEDFKVAEFRDFKMDSSTQSFTMSPSRWIKATNAKGIISKRGKYGGGTFAHPDIALEFASWLDPAFKLYLIKEFERLKYNEGYQQKVEWSVRRSLTKTNYKIHTDSIKEYIVPRLTEKQKTFVYATEADIINVALFGMTAKEWRKCNPEADGNIRDFANILHLIVLSNLEVLNANMIEEGKSQKERLEKLNSIARKQLHLLLDDKNIMGITEF